MSRNAWPDIPMQKPQGYMLIDEAESRLDRDQAVTELQSSG